MLLKKKNYRKEEKNEQKWSTNQDNDYFIPNKHLWKS
jgi:hypothetical protein